MKYKHILLATDLEKQHFHLCEKAKALAHEWKASLDLLHVIEPPPLLQLAQGLGFTEVAQPAETDAKQVMQLLGEALDISPTHLHVEVGSIQIKVLEKIKELHCDLFLMGSHAPSLLPAFLDNSAHSLIYHLPCDLMVLQPT